MSTTAEEIISKARYEIRWCETYLQKDAPYKLIEVEKARQRLNNAISVIDTLLQDPAALGHPSDEVIAFLAEAPNVFDALETKCVEAEEENMKQENSQKLDSLTRQFERAKSNMNYNGLDQVQRFLDDLVPLFDELSQDQVALQRLSTLKEDCFKAMEDYENQQAQEKQAKLEAIKERLNSEISYLPLSLKSAIDQGLCTYSATGEDYTHQPYFTCDDCPSGFMICVTCKDKCHSPSHKIRENYSTSTMYCDCGPSGSCHAMPATSKPSSPTSSHDQQVPAISALPQSSTVSSQLQLLPVTPQEPAPKLVPLNRRDPNFNNTVSEAWESFNSASEKYNYGFKQACEGVELLKDRDVDYCLNLIDSGLERAEWAWNSYEDAMTCNWDPLVQQARETMHSLKQHSSNCREQWKKMAQEAKGYQKVKNAKEWWMNDFNSAQESAKGDWGSAGTFSSLFEPLESLDSLAKEYHQEELTKGLFDQLMACNVEFCSRRFNSLMNQVEQGEEWAQYQLDGFVNQLQERHPNDPTTKSVVEKFTAWKLKSEDKEQEEQRQREKAEEEERLAFKQQLEMQRDTWLKPYTGGMITRGDVVYAYESNGHISGGQDAFDFDGFYITSDRLGKGEWNAENGVFRWYTRDRYVVVLRFDSASQTFEPDYDLLNHFLDTKFLWTNSGFTTNQAWSQKYGTTKSEGSVPMPVVLFISLLPFIQHRQKVLSGDHLCKSGLFDSKIVGKVCSNCRSDNCVACGDKMAFKNNPAMLCSFDANRNGCIRCDASASLPAFLCDKCKFTYSHQCTRTCRSI